MKLIFAVVCLFCFTAILAQSKPKQDTATNEMTNDAERQAHIDSLRPYTIASPVYGFFNDTLFFIYCRMGSFSAAERATAITQRIEKLKGIYGFSDSTLQLIESEATADIVHGENIIMSISDNDAVWNNCSKKELAQKYRDLISKKILTYKDEISFATLSKEIGFAAIVLVVLLLLIYLSSKLFKWTGNKIKAQESRSIKELKIKNYTVLNASKNVSLLLIINNIGKWIIILILVYTALPLIFGLFPWTQHFAQTLLGYVLNPLTGITTGVWNYFPNLITILVIFFVFRYAIKGIHFIKNEIEQGKLQLPGFYADWANPTFQILRIVLYAFMFVLIFPYLPGSDSPIFQGVSVFLGFLFTFGSAGSLSNIVAGIMLTYMRLFKIGDRVKIGEIVGDVTEKSLLVTRIKTIKNEIISVPNSTIMNSHTINYSNEADYGNGLIIHTTVTIGYDVPWRDMHQALLNAADRTSLLLKEPKPFVLQNGLEDFYVTYEINAYTKEPNKQANIYSELHEHIQDCCNEAGIEILSPHYRSARDGNMTSIPARYLSKDYESPAFKIKIEKE
jgi:small-conductance mechanosensitive channel